MAVDQEKTHSTIEEECKMRIYQIAGIRKGEISISPLLATQDVGGVK